MSIAAFSKRIIAVGFVVTGTLAAGPRTPDLEERVAAQWAIEDVYWRHRVWPAENGDAKPSLRETISDEAVRAKVSDALLRSEALDRFWGRWIGEADLRGEVARMVASSRAPAVLAELFAALGNDPDRVAECLARPVLSDRWIRRLYGEDAHLHAEAKAASEKALARYDPSEGPRSLGGRYTETLWVLATSPHAPPNQVVAGVRIRSVGRDSWKRLVTPLEALPVGVPGPIQEDGDQFFIEAIIQREEGRVRVATASWPKRPFDDWWTEARASLLAGTPLAVQPDRRLGAELSSPTSETESSVSPPPGAPDAVCTPDTWTATTSTGAPAPRGFHSAVWTGAEMIVWGGWSGSADLRSGSRYDPATNSWNATATSGAPTVRDSHTAVWTGSKMVVWGGIDDAFEKQATGGRYDPATNRWDATATTGAPTGRSFHTAVWTGSRMVVWGGSDATDDRNTGGRYDPLGDVWSDTSLVDAPTARESHSAVWTGSRMVIWGGVDNTFTPLVTGSRYDPTANTWQAMNVSGAAAARGYHTARWADASGVMVVWGGWNGTADTNTGGRYNPGNDQWLGMSTAGAPAAREIHTAVWTGSEVIVWGGRDDGYNALGTGGRYNPSTDIWALTPISGAPIARDSHTAVWTGPTISEMVVWGGSDEAPSGANYLDSGGRYCASSCAATPPTGLPTVTLAKEGGGSRISWTAVASATGYDLVRGGLATLRSTGGNFTSATDACLANDTAVMSYLDAPTPASSDGFWYLARGMNCGGSGSYDGPGTRQSGSRDAEINAAASACP